MRVGVLHQIFRLGIGNLGNLGNFGNMSSVCNTKLLHPVSMQALGNALSKPRKH